MKEFMKDNLRGSLRVLVYGVIGYALLVLYSYLIALSYTN
ncbi:hypothetical protein JBP901_gp033 [Bacillus phage JBP901]|uniref:Putative membrane protein n=1 Tax=Bacillus phage JBP901 TaxID=1498212 RepID=A0A0E3DF18_9CAUD|nr:hypothetical protein JBP901_gp033 [Bacillus phage JBP901]AID17746.1 putative membrane protein [Bacillus phage JBP901]